MKRIYISGVALVASVVLVGLGGTASAGQGERDRCSIATLKGGFGYTVSGALTGGTTSGPFAAVGQLTFDGAGNFENVRTISQNGRISGRIQGVGTYTVEHDCSGTLTFTDGGVVTLSTDLVIDADGDEFRMIATTPGTVLTVEGRRQFSFPGKR
ncbi:MAG: hypothetical protein WCF44_09585 [Candidatus Methylophosphatis roskildensis]